MASNYFNQKRGVDPNDQTNFNMYSQEDQDALNGNTSKRKANINYAAIGTAAASGAGMVSAAYNDPNSTGNDKYEATSNAASGTISSINPVIGAITGLGDSIGKPIKANSEQFDENGNLVNENKARRNAIVGSLFSPSKAFAYRSASGNWGDISGKGYTKWLEDQEKNRLDSLKPVADPYENIQRMAYGGIKYPLGGYSNQPNSEIEKQENVMLPDGGTFQGDGPTHENGGIKLNLPDNSLIFSDRLKPKGSSKTFAQLNKSNNTEKEDKILQSNRYNVVSKATAELMKQTKNKLSQELFEQQEALKQSKVNNYAKRMGINLDSLDSIKSNNIHMYPDGGKVDPKDFTYSQKLQAYSDSLNLYNSGNRPGQPNWKWPGANQSFLRLQTLNGQEPQPISKTNFTDNGNYTGESSQFKKPTKPAPYVQPVIKQPIKNSVNKQQDRQIIQPVNNQINQKIKTPVQSVQPQVKNYSTRQWDLSNPSFKTLNYYDQAGKIINTEQYDYNNQKVIPIIESFAHGGEKNSKKSKSKQSIDYSKYNVDSYNQDLQEANDRSYINQFKFNAPEAVYNESDDITVPNSVNIQKNNYNYSQSNNDNFNNSFDNNSFDNSNSSQNKTNWNEIAKQAAYFAANNVGNIYDLSRSNKVETTKYDRVKANLLDPTASIRDVDHQNRVAEYDIRSASNGNAGSYLANRTALATNAAINKDRITRDYQNANTQIKNQNAAINAQIQMRENDANEMNRANARSTKQAAIARIGSNTAQQMNDVRASEMDKRKVDALIKMYPALSKNPEMLNYILSYKK